MKNFMGKLGIAGGRTCRRLSVTAILFIFTLLTIPQLAQAFVFNCTSGDVNCLITSINTANGNGVDDTINLAAGSYILTAVNNDTNGPNGLPSITSKITINGASRNSFGHITTTIQRSTNVSDFRIFLVSSGGNLSLDRLIIATGKSDFGGGGILNNGGTVRLENSTVTGNYASGTNIGTYGSGGGIWNSGSLSLFNSTVSDNEAKFTGGGIISGGKLVVANSTVSGNKSRRVGGIFNQGNMTINNSTISGNVGEIQSGGILNLGTAKLRHVTVTNNTTLGIEDGNSVAGGILNSGDAKISLLNTILAKNINKKFQAPPDCKGTLTSQGYNLVGNDTGCNFVSAVGDEIGTSANPIDPLLDDVLKDDSSGNGATHTHNLLSGSPAINTPGQMSKTFH